MATERALAFLVSAGPRPCDHGAMDTSIKARAFWVTGPSRGELREETLRPLGDGDVLVESMFGAVSRGTEALVFRGDVPPSEYQRMRAPHQEGDFPAPIKYGYCNVGRVVKGPAPLLGRTVFALVPHQDRYVVPSDAVVPLPPDLEPSRAVLTANMETAVNGIWDGGISLGDRVCVIGAGVVGCLVAYLCSRIAGCEVELVDINARKREMAHRLGLSFALPAEARPDCDCVFEASGYPDALATALQLAGKEASVVALSWYGANKASLPLGEAFHSQRLRILSSQVGTLPASRRSRWSHRRRLEVALRLLEDPTLDALFTGSSPFSALPEIMPQLAAKDSYVLCHRIVYG